MGEGGSVVSQKHCNFCDRMLESSYFSVRRASPDGLSNKCRECASAYAKSRYRENSSVADAAKKRARKWVELNPEKRLEVTRNFRNRNLLSERARGREYVIRSRIKNPELARQKGIEASRIRRRRAIEADAFPHKEAARRLIQRANGLCTYCRGLFTSLTVDHFNPVVNGGHGRFSNLIPCCKSCNASKGAKDGAEWLVEQFGVERLVDVLRSVDDLYAARLP